MTWGDHAAHREPEQVDPVESKSVDERDSVARHVLDRLGGLAPRRPDAAVVEREHVSLRGDAVNRTGVPVVQHGAEVVQEDHRHTGLRAELAVGEGSPADLDGLVGCVLEGCGHAHVLSWSGIRE
jgi:hypothetical protein